MAINLWGKAPLCNKKRDRGIIINGFCLPTCTRCTFVTIGTLFDYVLCNKMNSIYYYKLSIEIRVILLITLCLPMIVDGVSQYIFKKESSNYRRAITGFLFGLGINFIAYYMENII